ncbi:two-component system response regulator NarL [Corallincola platygyrae]|uniref:Two-component system response regulator NarL n=1 Tax=Corallincola platygyrae TaxID=1193278 RepID=A0ABW4XN82_9GAMM
MSSQVHRVLVVDDHPLMRKGVIQLLALDPSFQLVGEASNGEEAVALALHRRPDLILLDLNMKGMDGLETLKELRAEGVDCHVIALTVSDAYEDVIAMLNQGANGYLLKDMEPENMLSSLRLAANGEQVLSKEIAGYLLQRPQAEQTPKDEKLSAITRRETEILALIAKGHSNREIGETLHISEGTVKVHVKSLLKKLGMKSRVEAAVWYLS